MHGESGFNPLLSSCSVKNLPPYYSQKEPSLFSHKHGRFIQFNIYFHRLCTSLDSEPTSLSGWWNREPGRLQSTSTC
jgi:hypothetical protein